ncbi:hypothetical protein [Ekhidna sp. To15]|uniref:hypothetical protein n=1 Tax=Ekhidna sp. To15 TaxID=3395267 RepID=UPI003F51E2D5
MQELVSQMDNMVLRGEIPQAVSKFFSEDAHTKDVDGSETSTREEAVQKLTGFVGSIAQVKEITLLNSSIGEDVSMSEFRFHFSMEDGNEINWHEVIRREWQNGLVVNETYFQN